ncbi:MAG: hypothetical protein ACE366_12230 [Bradymonadia bacterium]
MASPVGLVAMHLGGGPEFVALSANDTTPPQSGGDPLALQGNIPRLAAAIDRLLIQQAPYPANPGNRTAPTQISAAHERIYTAHMRRDLPNDPNHLGPGERQWLNDYMMVVGLMSMANNLQGIDGAGDPFDEGDQTGPLHPGRASVVSHALGLVGAINARQGTSLAAIPGTTEQVVWRYGAETLYAVFKKSGAVAGEDVPVGTIGTASKKAIFDSSMEVGGNNTGVPSWCGIFALAMQKMAGNASAANWPPQGRGTPWLSRQWPAVPGTEVPRIGDIALKIDGMHHGTVVNVVRLGRASYKVTTVDGNISGASTVGVHEEEYRVGSRSSYWSAFYRAFEDPPAQPG